MTAKEKIEKVVHPLFRVVVRSYNITLPIMKVDLIPTTKGKKTVQVDVSTTMVLNTPVDGLIGTMERLFLRKGKC